MTFCVQAFVRVGLDGSGNFDSGVAGLTDVFELGGTDGCQQGYAVGWAFFAIDRRARRAVNVGLQSLSSQHPALA